jgi:hypothetical protein
VEALYPLLVRDSDGQKPDCSTNRYTLTFPPGQFPPVNAFWSVTICDGKTQLLVRNPINRYLINSPMLPQFKKTLTTFRPRARFSGETDSLAEGSGFELPVPR